MKKHLCHALLLIALAALSLSSCSLLPTEKKPNVEQTTVEAATTSHQNAETENTTPSNTEEIETNGRVMANSRRDGMVRTSFNQRSPIISAPKNRRSADKHPQSEA